MLHSDKVHGENWSGCIPVILTLAAASNSSPNLPPPLHALIPRHSFLHVALEQAVRRLHAFAPPAFFGAQTLKFQEPAAGTVYEEDSDQEDKAADATATEASKASSPTKQEDKSNLTPTPFPICWFEDEVSQTALRWHVFAGVLYDLRNQTQPDLPWRIRLHFTSYPTSQILPLDGSDDVLDQVRYVFKNSLKQAMCLHYGNSKPALNLTKDSHGKIWESLRTANYNLYKQAHSGLPKQKSSWVPIRILVDGGPPIQKPCRGAAEGTTLGKVLYAAVPALFAAKEGATEDVVNWKIAGISRPPLDVPIQDYWVNLAHPDHFLYIVVLTKQ